jgi:hypothetical protein
VTNEQYIELLQAIREHSGLELASIREAGEHGADAGWNGFIWTTEAAEFYRANSDTIDDMLQEDADAVGCADVASLIASFVRSDMADTRDGRDCLLAWYALESVGRMASDRLYERNHA